MLRTALLSAGVAVIVAWSWTRLEHPRPGIGGLAVMAALGIAPALVPRLRWRLAAAGAALLAGASIALDVSRPYALGSIVDRAATGFLDFYDVLVPFDGAAHPLMHGVLLLAVFTFSLLAALAIATRRPLGAILALVAGAGWPATIFPGNDDLGVVLLVASLALVALVRPLPGRAAAQIAAGTAVVALGMAASSWSAVAKGQFVDWQDWDFYTKPDNPVSVEYVWRANYDGLSFPPKRTRVLTVRAPARSAYWRATTLDAFVDGLWDEDLVFAIPDRIDDRALLTGDPLLPPGAADPGAWTRADVKIDALRDFHLLGGPQPVAYDTGSIAGVRFTWGGIARAATPLSRGQEYTVWGYTPQPRPAELSQSRPDYPYEIVDGPYLTVDGGKSVPPFGEPGREQWLASFFANYRDAAPYEPLYEVARDIAGRARNPYAATVALEAWFRSGGGFTYDQTPPRARRLPPLVHFVTETKQGYCQHFAGAMALMLRYLGIPARVAAGFTSGTYDADRHTWDVYDRNAHTWVEVWFEGYGWLSFDPTPSRGNLGGPYTASSLSFDARGAAGVLAASAIAAQQLLRFELGLDGRPGRGDPGGGATAAGKTFTASGGDEKRIGIGTILVLAALALALLLAAGKLTLRWGRYLTADPRRLASACRRELVEFLLDQRIDVPQGASLGELRQLVRTRTGVDPRLFAEALGLARFGPLPTAPAAAQRARRELRMVRRRLRRSLPVRKRVRGLFSLRSLLAGA